jgi:triacylglycerol lipase
MTGTIDTTPISQHTADEIGLHSELQSPIANLSNLRRSLLLAELSMIAYLSEHEAKRAARRLNFDEVQFFDRDGAQAYKFENNVDCVIACRGTEPNEWNDIRADANAITALAETMGRVHRGFKREVDDLWPRIEETLINNTKILWFTGHSLGGAMATICAGRCMLSHIPSNPQQLQTFGSPRVGDKRFVHFCKIDYSRWVNNNDIVARVPPAWMGYRHSGDEIYLNARGKIRQVGGWQRTKDLWRGFVKGIKQGKIDHFEDHSIMGYIEHIYQALSEEEDGIDAGARVVAATGTEDLTGSSS